MKLSQVIQILEAQVLCGKNVDKVEVESACGSDLMSDVLCFGKSRSLLLTGLTNPQAVRTAEMSEISAVCFVRGKQPPKETVELAIKCQIPLLSTGESMYTACGRLFAAGLRGSENPC
jgi:predicted transcriptional regulator